MTTFFDRDGQPIEMWHWVALTGRREDYVRVAETRGPSWSVSTIWLGIDMSFGRREQPVIFETMVFGGPLDQEMWRWSSEAEARAGHEVIVAMVEAEIRRLRLAGMRKRKRSARQRHSGR